MLRKLRIYRIHFNLNKTSYSTRAEIDTTLREDFESDVYKPRKHPGTIRKKVVAVPHEIQNAIKIVLQDTNAKAYYSESIDLSNYLRSRLLPPDQQSIDIKAKKIHDSVSKTMAAKLPKNLTEEEKYMSSKETDFKVFKILQKNVYRWANIEYNQATSLQYLIARAAPEYAILVRIFDEISKKNPEYLPRSFFDFGSGIGTGTWAVNTVWPNSIFDYFSVDTSIHMHDLCTLILRGGKENVELPYKAYFQRNFLPASSNIQYDVVLSAYTLFEMPDIQSRLSVIQKLWDKTKDYLIIVEYGSNAGFQIVNEARDYVLNLSKHNKNRGYVFSPCPNDNVCPRYLEKATPCNFIMKYESLPYFKKSEVHTDLFSYVVLRKGQRPKNDSQWPRLVRPPIVRSGHTICKLCTDKGELQEIIFTKTKHDRITYRCARSANWGDELPIKINNT